MGARGPLTACGGGGNYCFDRDKDNREWPDTFSGTLEYGPCPAADKGFVLQYTARAGNQHDNYPACNGKCFYGTDATLLVHRGGCWLMPEIRASKKVEKKEIEKDYDSTDKHVAAFIGSLRSSQAARDRRRGGPPRQHSRPFDEHRLARGPQDPLERRYRTNTSTIARPMALVTKKYRARGDWRSRP